MKILKIFIFCSWLIVNTLVFASTNDNVSSALIAEFYLQNDEPDEAYLAYQEIVENQSNQVLAERVLHIANLTDNKEWQQKSMGELLKFKQNDIKLAAKYMLSFVNDKQSKVATVKLQNFFDLLKKTTQNEYGRYMSLAITLSQAENSNIATQLLQKYIIKTSVPSLNGAASYFYLLKQYKVALKYLKISLKLDPNLDKTLIIFADVLYLKGSKKEAVYLLEEKLTTLKSIPLSTALVIILIKNKQYKESVPIYLQLIKQDADNANKWRKILSSVYLVLKEIDDARAILLELLANEAYQDYANYSLGLLSEELEDNETAKEFYNKVIMGKYYFRAKKRLARLVALDDKDAGLKIIDEINISRLEDYIDLLTLKIIIYEIHKEWKKAYEIYTAAIVLQPNNNHLYYNRALLAERMGKIDLMEQDLKLVISKDKNHFDALNALGYSLTVHTKRYKEAKKYIERALKLQPKSFYILDSLGWVSYKMGNKKQAIKFLKKALEIKEDAETLVHLSTVLRSIGKNNKSNKYLLRAISLDKDNPAVLKALKSQLK